MDGAAPSLPTIALRVGLIQALDLMTILLRTMFIALLLAAPHISSATSDGELAWTNVTFCNGADICVSMSTNRWNGLDALAITNKGRSISNLPKPGNDLPYPLLQDTKLISVARADGGFENRLEITFLDTSMRKFIYLVSFSQGSVYKTEVVAAPPAPV